MRTELVSGNKQNVLTFFVHFIFIFQFGKLRFCFTDLLTRLDIFSKTGLATSGFSKAIVQH